MNARRNPRSSACLLSLVWILGMGGAATAVQGQCALAICPTNTSIPGQAGGLPPMGYSRSVQVQTGTGCPWTASSTVSWIRIVSSTNGVGPGTVQLSITNSSNARHATITIGNRPYQVWQGAADTVCTYDIVPGGRIVGAMGDSGSFVLTAPHGCAWSAAANKEWITITGVSGFGVCGDFTTDGVLHGG